MLPPLPNLREPAAFVEWWRECRVVLGIAPALIVAALEEVGSHISLVRASQVLGHDAAARSPAKELAGRALESPDPPVRLFALFRLAMLETKLGYGAGSRDVHGAPAALPLLRSLLQEVESSPSRDRLLVEVEARVHKALGEGYTMTGEYERAEAHLGHSVALADALGMRSFVDHGRILLGLVAMHDGRVAEAVRQLGGVARDSAVEPVYAGDAHVFLAMGCLWLGDDDAALALLDGLAAEPDRPEHSVAYRDCVLALTGRGGLQAAAAEYRRVLPNELALVFEAFQRLLRANGRPGNRDREKGPQLEAVRGLLDEFRAPTGWLRALGEIPLGLVALRLGEVGLAADAVPGALAAPGDHNATRALGLGLALEVGLHFQGRDAVPLARATSELHDLLAGLPATSRASLARRFAVFLPLAGAFLAYSPRSTREVLSSCGPGVLNLNARPITAWGRGGLRPAHGVRFTLEAFGFDGGERLDGGGQLEAEEAVLLQPHGERLHWFTPIPPALLVYQYLRVHELAVGSGRLKEDSPWRAAALDLARSHGLLPEGARGHRARERQQLESALRLMLSGDLTAAGFRALVGTLP